MKLTLKGALHARPANLFVRVATTFVAMVELRKGDRRADAKNILEVLTLGAGRGDVVDIVATGDDAEGAIAALAMLVERDFDADLVPETGAAAAPGIAVGAALVLASEAKDADALAGEASESADLGTRQKLASAFAEVGRDLEALVETLPAEEAALFAPEIAIVAALEAPVTARVLSGEAFALAIDAELASRRAGDPTRTGDEPRGGLVSDLVRDARDRLREAHSGESRSKIAGRLATIPAGDVVLVAHELTPSLVSSLPRRVTGIIAAENDLDTKTAGVGYASHAAILARGRAIPLIYVAPHVSESIADGDVVVVDTRSSPAQLFTSPSEARIAGARAAVADAWRERRAAEKSAPLPLTHLVAHGGVPFAVRVNVSTVHDHVPTTSDGIGLVRTELLHAGKKRVPGVDEQLATLALVAGKIAEGPIVVRLFDGGGDKPLAWIPAPSDAAGARGIALLARYPDVLRDQVTAIARAGESADVRILIPFVERAADVEGVRALCPTSLAVGAMVESVAGVAAASSIAAASDFICIGTNDLAASIRGEDRAKMAPLPLDPGVLAAISEVVAASHGAGRAVTVCGEMAGEPEGALVLVGLGVDAISVAPSRLASVRSALASASKVSTSEAVDRAMGKERGTP